MKIILILFAVFMGISFARGDSETAKGAAKDFENFKNEMSAKMDDVDRQLSELRAKAKAKGGEVQNQSVKELEDKRAKLKAEIDSLNEGTKSSWKAMKKSLSASIDSLHAKAKKALED